MSSISSITGSSYSQYSQYTSQSQHRRPDPSKMAEDLFSQLDTKGQGYLEKSDLESALSSLDGDSSSASIDEVFSALDGDGDGKVTQDEMTSSLQKLAQELDAQFNASRMGAAQGAMPPPPPPAGGGQEEDEGLTLEQVNAMASDTSDSKLSELLDTISANFDAADANGDGKVTRQEAMDYQQSQQSASDSASSSSSNSSAAASSDAAVMKRIMDLVHSYGGNGFSQVLSSLSTSA